MTIAASLFTVSGTRLLEVKLSSRSQEMTDRARAWCNSGKRMMSATIGAVVEASSRSMSIVMVAVGEGPWHVMDKFDDDLPRRDFDNFQYVDFNTAFNKYPKETREVAFATHALMELPEQYQAVKAFKLLDNCTLLEETGHPMHTAGALHGPSCHWHWSNALENVDRNRSSVLYKFRSPGNRRLTLPYRRIRSTRFRRC